MKIQNHQNSASFSEQAFDHINTPFQTERSLKAFQEAMSSYRLKMEEFFSDAFSTALSRYGFNFRTNVEMDAFIKERVLRVRVEGTDHHSFFIMPGRDYLFTLKHETRRTFSHGRYLSEGTYKADFDNPPKVNFDTIVK